jgi:hypothetical protein
MDSSDRYLERLVRHFTPTSKWIEVTGQILPRYRGIEANALLW